AGARHRDLRPGRAGPRAAGRDPAHAAVAGQSPHRRHQRHGGARLVAARNATVDKKRLILDAAVRVFARQGFHTCRVSDIADEADVAYGLVYHYFKSKDQILDTLFLERSDVLLRAIAEAGRRPLAAAGERRPVG